MKFAKSKKVKDSLVHIMDATLAIPEAAMTAMITDKPSRLLFNPFYDEKRADGEHYRYLHEQKLLKRQNEPSTGRVLYCMTSDGACIAALEKMRDIVDKPIRKWDGIWRGVTFDIPENKRAIRDFLRRYLRELGLHRLHQSLWVTPHDITKYFRLYIVSAKLEKWVNIMEVKNIYPDEKRLRMRFFK